MTFFTLDNSLTLSWGLCALLLSFLIMQLLRKKTSLVFKQKPLISAFFDRINHLSFPLFTLILIQLGTPVLATWAIDASLLVYLSPLVMGWLLVAAVHALTKSRIKTVFAAFLVLPFCIPFVATYAEEVEKSLSSLAVSLGKTQITALQMIKVGIGVIVLIWLTQAIVSGIEAALRRMRKLRSTTRQLFVNLARIGTYALIGLFVLSTLGIDLTAFAFLGGAIGVGIGFGLQKIASNFISGMILLSEHTIEVNDLIEMPGGDVFGLVKHTGARYTLIETLDQREIMIPNEDFISQRVINWTHTNTQGLITISIGVAYNSDLEKVRDILIQSATEYPRCLKNPEPSCHLTNFGSSSIDFQLFFWVADIREKRLSAKSDVMFSIWRKFKENGIEIPFPQMDVHVKKTAG